MSDAEIDEAILTVTFPSWRKVALIIVWADKLLGNETSNDEARLDRISERVGILVSEGRLLARGDTRNWRYSEIQKPT
jgi:hypothetical protein